MTHEMAKMTQNLLRKLKITDFLLDLDCSRDFLVGIGGYTCILLHVRERSSRRTVNV